MRELLIFVERNPDINKFATDTEAEMNAVRNAALAAGVYNAVICSHHAHGGKEAV